MISIFNHKKIYTSKILPLLLFSLVINTANAESIFTFRCNNTVDAEQRSYRHRVLLLALEKTSLSHASFQIKCISGMNIKRARAEIKKNTYPNFLEASGGTRDLFEQYQYAPFPIDLGLLGYRFPVYHKDNIGVLAKETTFAELKTLSIIQGAGWVDTKILTINGFSSVSEVEYESIDDMVLYKRVDAYFSSMSDIYKFTNKDLSISPDIAIYYEMPRFFISSKENKAAIDRVYAGLIIAYQDGSLANLLDEFFLEKINKLNILNKQIFELDNPLIQGLDKRYQTWRGLQSEYLKSRAQSTRQR